ncbi:hypothetical protein [Brevundimonas sp. ZS04]|uniref:hypothetical protein n=1 Tax=Brevundimonas sp. ZS04 TaxID=1906854 RepID=UPI00096F3308|nr:hypothetical protein [Brevundimonas sp. ZS04]OMG57641.1 hypothetical protein BJP32_12130 [Brevundimonas sp. ZS04]
MTDTPTDQDNVIVLHNRWPDPSLVNESIDAALQDAGAIAFVPDAGAENPRAISPLALSPPRETRHPNRLAIACLLTLAILSFVAAFWLPPTPEGGLRYDVVYAIVAGVLAFVGALLCKYVKEFWIERPSSSLTAETDQSEKGSLLEKSDELTGNQ